MLKNNEYDKDEHIYYTAVLSNPYTTYENDIVASIDISTSNILDKQSKYELAIQGFTLVGDLPIFQMYILSKTQGNLNEDPNMTIFGVCFSYNGVDYPTRLTYVNNSFRQPLPFVNGVNDNSNGYYNVWYFQTFIDMINNSILTSFNDMKNAQTLPSGITEAPYFIYNSTTGLISLICQYNYSLNNAPKLYMNSLLYNYVYGIRIYINGKNQQNFKDFNFMIVDLKNNWYGVPTITSPPSYLSFTQEYDSRYMWGDIRSIVITSNTIKSRAEYLPAYTNPNSTKNRPQTNNPNFYNILSNFDIVINSGDPSWLQPIQYAVTEYKWIDLISDEPLNRINLSIFTTTSTGELFPFYIPSQQICTIKLLFRKKK